jgi:hypothetical protein
VPVIEGEAVTVIVAVLFADKVLEQDNELVICVTVIVDEPAVVKPVASKVPVPSVETVKVAVLPVWDGNEVL